MDKNYLGKKRLYEVLKGEFPFAPLMKECKYSKRNGHERIFFNSWYDSKCIYSIHSFSYGSELLSYIENYDEEGIGHKVGSHRISLAEPSESEQETEKPYSVVSTVSEEEESIEETYTFENENEDEIDITMEDYISVDCNYCNASSCADCWRNEEREEEDSSSEETVDCDDCDGSYCDFCWLYKDDITQEEWVSHFDDWRTCDNWQVFRKEG